MLSSMSSKGLGDYLERQLAHHFPDDSNLRDLRHVVPRALQRVEYCFHKTTYFQNWKNGDCYFNHLNSDHYVIFVYFASNVAYEECKNIELASKLFYLNKMMHSFHCMYDTQLPDIFIVLHGVGAVLGKATYGNYFVVTQNCTVGSNYDGDQPVFQDFVMMYPGSSVLGKTTIGKNSCISNGAFLNDIDLGAGKLAFGRSPNVVVKSNKPDRLHRFFKLD